MTRQYTGKPATKNVNKILYAGFVFMSIYFLVTKDFSQSMVFLGTALIFDPFNTQTPFDKRPVYQRVWLIVHLAITLGLFVLMVKSK